MRSLFFIRVVFSMVIHSGISVFCMHLFIWVVRLSWMEVKFLNQNLCMPSRPEVFQFDILGFALGASGCIFTWAFRTLFPCCLFIRHFLMIFPFQHLALKTLCHSRIRLLAYSPLLFGRSFFRCVRTSYVFILRSYLSIFLVFLL